jgi:hypothetical protein
MPHDMTIAEALSQVKSICVDGVAPKVFHTAARELAQACGGAVEVGGGSQPLQPEPGVFHLLASPGAVSDDAGLNRAFIRLRRDGAGFLEASPARSLFSFVTHLLRDLADDPITSVEEGRVFETAFRWLRSTYDYFLNQEGRIQRGLNRETYVRRLAESAFTHLEVNGLAFPSALESGPPGEAYPMFYGYCPALDQFVSSELNRGLYPDDYLSANLEYLKRNAELAREYGMVPGLLCFEPRSVPEEFFQRYPMLRGARVDHPFRSFKPRYNMTIAHPLVREHYAEMVRRLMKEVPELGFLSIWTNDSGAGFEHTQSLYVGRNGGAYLIREWKDESAIAQAAGDNALRFFEVLRNAARETNPDFRVVTRLESFYGEHDVIWNGLGDGLEVETASLVAKGWEMPYAHARYPDSKSFVAGSIHQQSFAPDERRLATELEERSSRAHFYMAAGPNSLFAPLIGVPYPSLTFQRLKLLHESGVTHVAHLNGTGPPELVPFNVNHEIFRHFQFDPRMDLSTTLEKLARRWAGEGLDNILLRAWGLAEEAIEAFPHVSPLYSTFGSVWYRLWARPLVPNIEAIPAAERAYYQNFMCTTPHNPNNVDLSRDVLFQLTTVPDCRTALARMDANVWDPLDAALEFLDGARARASEMLGSGNVIEDQFVRLSALRCWLMTQRSVAAWVVGACGYMQATTESERSECRAVLDDMISKELENSERLLALLDSDVEFMATTDLGESALMYGRNLKEMVEKRMGLMSAHRGNEPYIDPEYIERSAGQAE